jgi:serine/threonine protein kinase
MSDDNPDGPSRPKLEHLGVVLQSVLKLSPEDRNRWIDESSAGDIELREQLSELVRHAQTAHPPGSHEQIPSDRDAKGNASSVQGTGSSPVPGQRLGRYEVLDLLGSGGMGSVYRALDPSLGREVAIKALAQAFLGDTISLRRFEREARVLATLNHPNIATIYGFERLDGSPYLVLERVEGDTLARRLSRGPMPVEEALAVAVQIVAGLEEAHAKGVIHRDLKPSNVMLTPDGRAKLVDFGLAKKAKPRLHRDVSAAPITEVGIVLGTARYMSPEQISGDDVDERTDVWAFGCVLYEMLTAQPAFAGHSVSDTVAAVLRDEPNWQVLPADTPRSVRRLLRRCVRRDPRRRLQHIGDARLELLEVEDEPNELAGSVAPPKWVRPVRVLFVAAAVLAAFGAFFLLRSQQSVPALHPARLSLELPARMALGNEYSAPFAIAPAGTPLVLQATEGGATRRLYIRELGDPDLRALPGTEGAQQPFFSNDGAWVAFFAERKLSKTPVAGGPVLHLADIGGNARGAAWAPDGTIVVAPGQTSGLVRVPDGGGKPIPLTALDKARGEYSHRWPDVLPGGKWVLFTVGLEDATFDEARIDAVSVETGERRLVLTGAGFARYASNGRLLFVRGGHLHSVGFDPERLVVSGTPEVVLDAVRYDWRNGGCHLAVSASGVLLYAPGAPNSSEYYLSWVDRDGQLTRAVDTPRPFRDIKASPDGRRVAIAIGTSVESDLWLVEANGTLSRLSFSMSPHRPTWTPDGAGITVGSEKDGSWRLLTVAADGKGDPAVLFESSHRMYPNAWSPDGRYLIFQESRPETGWDLRFIEVDAAGRPVGASRAFSSTPFHESSAAISLDGRWVAYESDELDGVVQVYARSFPEGVHKVRASTGGARWPAWDANRNLHYWQTGEGILRVMRTQEESGQLIVGNPEPVWGDEAGAAVRDRAVVTVAGARYDLEPTGTRFLMLERTTPPSAPDLSQPLIVLGWAIELGD